MVVCVDGDGSFQMTAQELVTSIRADLPVVVVILNNQRLGMVHQWQTLFHEQRLSEVDLSLAMPDYENVARSYGALGATVSTEAELVDGLAAAFAAERTFVLDVRVDARAECYPMIPPGGAAAEQVEWAEGMA
jgi:acetolactate synthase-1/2/3 large subunit